MSASRSQASVTSSRPKSRPTAAATSATVLRLGTQPAQPTLEHSSRDPRPGPRRQGWRGSRAWPRLRRAGCPGHGVDEGDFLRLRVTAENGAGECTGLVHRQRGGEPAPAGAGSSAVRCRRAPASTGSSASSRAVPTTRSGTAPGRTTSARTPRTGSPRRTSAGRRSSAGAAGRPRATARASPSKNRSRCHGSTSALCPGPRRRGGLCREQPRCLPATDRRQPLGGPAHLGGTQPLRDRGEGEPREVAAKHCAAATEPPSRRTWAARSATNRVLPAPASPVTSSSRAAGPAPRATPHGADGARRCARPAGWASARRGPVGRHRARGRVQGGEHLLGGSRRRHAELQLEHSTRTGGRSASPRPGRRCRGTAPSAAGGPDSSSGSRSSRRRATSIAAPQVAVVAPERRLRGRTTRRRSEKIRSALRAPNRRSTREGTVRHSSPGPPGREGRPRLRNRRHRLPGAFPPAARTPVRRPGTEVRRPSTACPPRSGAIRCRRASRADDAARVAGWCAPGRRRSPARASLPGRPGAGALRPGLTRRPSRSSAREGSGASRGMTAVPPRRWTWVMAVSSASPSERVVPTGYRAAPVGVLPSTWRRAPAGQPRRSTWACFAPPDSRA